MLRVRLRTLPSSGQEGDALRASFVWDLQFSRGGLEAPPFHRWLPRDVVSEPFTSFRVN